VSPSFDVTSMARPADGVDTNLDNSAFGPTRPGASTVLYMYPVLTGFVVKPISCFCASSILTVTGPSTFGATTGIDLATVSSLSTGFILTVLGWQPWQENRTASAPSKGNRLCASESGLGFNMLGSFFS